MAKEVSSDLFEKEVRPWGAFKQFALNEKCTVKILNVKRGESLSLQFHKNRREVWYFLTSGFVQIDGKVSKFKKGDAVEIKKRVEHRLFAKATPVRVLEISFGNFSEKDEVRVLDKYGRK